MRTIHEFDNGIKVYDSQLLENQRMRYAKHNVHEEDDEGIFIDIIESLPNHACYVNVGTAIGYYPLLAKKIRPDIRIHCFEPLPRHLFFFHENIKLNGFTNEDFKIYDMAVSTKSSKVVLKDQDYGSYVIRNSPKRLLKDFLRRIVGKQIDQSSIFVDAILLSDVFRLVGRRDVDFLQMDIQGHEETVLATYFSDIANTSGCIRSFLVGTHGDRIHENCRNLFINNGYILKIDEPDTKNQPDGIIYCCISHE